ncbi:hypothetical protein [Burkholderia sp. 22PA0106]|uniref:hypothetical protein n=1 Tax=Burkholderia sp. 22PA0106 TaxID=3237371 RepID=UPI0039C14C29
MTSDIARHSRAGSPRTVVREAAWGLRSKSQARPGDSPRALSGKGLRRMLRRSGFAAESVRAVFTSRDVAGHGGNGGVRGAVPRCGMRDAHVMRSAGLPNEN